MRSHLARWITVLMLICMAVGPAQAAGFKWSDIFGGSAKDAYSFKWMDKAGAMHSLGEFKGRALIIHFWASWCRPCTEEMSGMLKWVKAHPDVTFLPVSLDKNARDAERFLTSREIDFPVLLTDEAQARGIGAVSLPTTMVIATDGAVKQNHRGPRDWNSSAFSSQLLDGLGAGLSGQAGDADVQQEKQKGHSGHEFGH